jgi:hypothetical protein
VTEIAYDFIPLKANLKEEELESYMLSHCYFIFQKDAVVNGQDKRPVPDTIPMTAVTF